MTYNPFTKSHEERLDEADLAGLVGQGVAEGYYVEYKRQLPAPPKIARSVAAFANTYGGWYIVGVTTDAHNVASEVAGFSLQTTSDPIAVVRDSVRHYVDPAPLFFPQIVTLQSGSIACVVYVPGNQATPFITKDGRIYRRTSDSSEPVPEANRYALDELVARGRAPGKAFERFASDDRTFSDSEKQGWAHIYIAPEPVGLVVKANLLEHDCISQLLASTTVNRVFLKGDVDFAVSGNIPCNSARPTPTSVILRQVAPERDAFNSLSLEYDHYGRARIHIPLDVRAEHTDWNTGEVKSEIARSVIENRIAPPGQTTYLKQFDIGRLWLVTAIFVTHYLDWLGSESTLDTFRVALGFSKTWRYVPFVDADAWGTYVSTFGVPVATSDMMRFPINPDNRVLVRRENLWFEICREQGHAFGLTSEMFGALLSTALVTAQSGRLPSNL